MLPIKIFSSEADNRDAEISPTRVDAQVQADLKPTEPISEDRLPSQNEFRNLDVLTQLMKTEVRSEF